MDVFRDDTHDWKQEQIRDHPWIVTWNDPIARYVDFRKHPEKIESSLEDFIPYAHYPMVQRYYEFLRWVNGPESILETNDCALRISPNATPELPYKMQGGGRIMFFATDLRLTCHPDWSDQFLDLYKAYLSPMSSLFPACIGLFKGWSYFLAVKQVGAQAGLNTYAWGNTEEEVMDNLLSVYTQIFAATRIINAKLIELGSKPRSSLGAI